MPGFNKSKPLSFKERPVLATLAALVAVNCVVMLWVGGYFSPFRADALDNAHTVAVHYRGGMVYFFSPAVATYLALSLAAPLVLFLASILTSWVRSLFAKRAR